MLAVRIFVRNFGRPRSSFRVFLALCLSLHPHSSFGQTNHPTESQVKAAYLFNFGKFVRWPVDRVANSESLEICVFGKDPFGAVLNATVGGESIRGRQVTVRRLNRIQEVTSCSILYVSPSAEGQLSQIFKVAQAGILTVATCPTSPNAAAPLAL